MTNPDTLAGGVKLALHGPFKTDPFASYIYGSNDKVGGDTIVLDIRGWGYLTGNGHGALGLEHSAGMLEQKRFAEFVVNALNAAEAASPPKPSEAMVEARSVRAALHMLKLIGEEVERHLPDARDAVAKNNIGYYAKTATDALTAALSGGAK